MAKQINPRWYAPRSCFRVRKTINGKTRTFYGGNGAHGPNDQEAKARAVLEISEQILSFSKPKPIKPGLLVELEGLVEDQYKEIVVDRDMNYLEQAAEEVGELAKDGKRHPLFVELEELREANAQYRSQIRLAGATALTMDSPLKALQERYAAVQRQQGEAQGVTLGTQTYYERTARELVEYLAEQEVVTAVQFEQASSIIAGYRDSWVQKINAGDCSHSTAKKSLLGARQFVDWMVENQHISRMPPSIGRKWTAVGVDEVDPKFLTVEECRTLFKDAPHKLKLPFLLGLNCGYREVDIRSLKREFIDIDKGVILRQRHKSKKKVGKPQAHKLWPITLRYLKEHLEQVEVEPFAKGYSNLSMNLTDYIKKKVPQDPDIRTAKSLRSTGAEEIGKIAGSHNPKVVTQYLAQGDMAMAKHYRNEDTVALFDALEKLGKLFNLSD